MKHLIQLIVAVGIIWLNADADANAETIEFTHTARVVMGSRETQAECREFAKVEARRAVLDQVGVYIEGRNDLMQTIHESASGISDSTDMQKRGLAIAAGVTQ